MYLATNYRVVFPENRGRKAFSFSTISSGKITNSWQSLTDNAEVVIAKSLYLAQQGEVKSLIKPGDPIEILSGYNGTLYSEFQGFCLPIHDDFGVTIKCEDNMYLLKRISVNKSYSNVTLKKLLADIIPEQFTIDAYDVNLGKILLKSSTVSEALSMLKDTYGIYTYFDGNTLRSGKIYADNGNTPLVKYVLGQNIRDNNLVYRTKDDIKIKVQMTSYLSNGTKKIVTVGDKDGQTMQLICSNVNDDASIKALANKELDRLKYDGYQGTLTSFGIPFVQQGYTAQITDNYNPDRSGNYYVDSVVTDLHDNGSIVRTVKIGPKAAA